MAKKKLPRRCSRFRCAELGDYICCADCERRPLCLAACQNDPERCGLEDKRSRGQQPKRIIRRLI